MMGEINGRVAYAHRMGLLSDELYMAIPYFLLLATITNKSFMPVFIHFIFLFQSAKENCLGDYINIQPDNHLCKDDVQRIDEVICF